MDWLPGADTSRVLTAFKTPLGRCRGVVDHVAVSESAFPSYSSGLGAHFYVRKRPGWRLGMAWDPSGIAQQISIKIKGGHAYQGNADLIGVETQGGVYNANGEPWDDYQLFSLAYIAWWCRLQWGGSYPLQLMGRSDDTGIGWHRLGCRGNFPALPDIRAGFNQRPGSWQLWSTATGKICPGDAKVQQMPTVLALAQQLANGTPPTPTPVPPEDDMFSDSDRALLQQTLAAAQAATAEAQRATAAANAATVRAQAATDQAAAATRAAELARTDSRSGTGMVLAGLADQSARSPRVNQAQYGRITAASYGALAEQAVAQGIDYLHLSGQLAGVQVPALGPAELAAIEEAAREGAAEGGATGGTFTLVRGS